MRQKTLIWRIFFMISEYPFMISELCFVKISYFTSKDLQTT